MLVHEYIALALLAASIASVSISVLLLRKVTKYYKAIKAILEVKGSTTTKKPRKRYIVFTVLCEEKVSQSEIEKAITEKLAEYYGQSILHKASLYVVFFDETTGRGVIRTSHTCLNHVIASMGLIKSINGKRCIIMPIRTTGTLKKAQEFMAKVKI